ncbi:cytosolic protein [Candidatus Woesearchaeota archaeon]|nr:cytosolic protein [Candidatus Woesearchaeota archaeon]
MVSQQALLQKVSDYIKRNIHTFHDARLKCLQNTNLKVLIRKKNPYLFRAKDLNRADRLVASLMEARLSSSEEELCGRFLEDLAIFVAQINLGARKSSTQGIDLEYDTGTTRYLVAIKSGLNWGNSSQWKALVQDFSNASRVLSQSTSVKQVQAILGVCYGNAKTTIRKAFIKQMCGQAFWGLVSGHKDFYKIIVNQLGDKAKHRNEQFNIEKDKVINMLTKQLLTDFCDKNGNIKWDKLMEENSRNL